MKFKFVLQLVILSNVLLASTDTLVNQYQFSTDTSEIIQNIISINDTTDYIISSIHNDQGQSQLVGKKFILDAVNINNPIIKGDSSVIIADSALAGAASWYYNDSIQYLFGTVKSAAGSKIKSFVLNENGDWNEEFSFDTDKEQTIVGSASTESRILLLTESNNGSNKDISLYTFGYDTTMVKITVPDQNERDSSFYEINYFKVNEFNTLLENVDVIPVGISIMDTSGWGIVENYQIVANTQDGIMLYSCDTSNNVLWQREFTGDLSSQASAVVGDGGKTFICGISDSYNAPNYDPAFFSFNIDGNIADFEYYSNELGDDNSLDIAKEVYSDMFIIAVKEYVTYDSELLKICEIDRRGSIIKQRDFYNGQHTITDANIKSKNDSIFLATVRIDNGYGISNELIYFNYLALSVQTYTAHKFNLYPNPATDVVYINQESNKISERLKISVIDMSGRILLQNQFDYNQNQLDVSNLEKGLYLIVIESDNWMSSERLIIE